MSSANCIRVSKQIEDGILSGQFKPRERLIETELLVRYGLSRTVIREALRNLEAKGLVRTSPYRGAVVADLTAEEIEEIYFVRKAIEKIAARLVAKQITSEDILALKRKLKEVERHLRQRTPQMIEKDSEFHRMIFSVSRNRYLCDIIDFLRTKAHIVQFSAWSLPDRIEQSITEHRNMIRALEKRAYDEFEALVVKHLTFSKRSYMARLRKGGNPASRASGVAPLVLGRRKEVSP